MNEEERINLRELLGTDKVSDIEVIPGFIGPTKDEFIENKDLLISLYQVYKEYDPLVKNLHYPAYFNKGKNGPDLFSICLAPEKLNKSSDDYSYFKGVYIDLGFESKNKTYLDIYIDGERLYYERDCLKEDMPYMLEYILSMLTNSEFKLVQKFINNQ
ncbi:MAG: hypothetical protein ACOC1O_00565 [bacterium]